MAILSDSDIKKALREGRLKISNLVPENISVASVDLRLGNEFRVFRHTEVTHVDAKEGLAEEFTELIRVPTGKPFTVHPGEFVLGSTIESVCLPADLTARLDGKSSLGRLGLVIHSTAGSVDPGFEGVLVLEIANISKVPVRIWPGMEICRLTFEELSSPSENPYNKRKNSRFLGQKGPCLGK
ncbi:MAG: dCTP deaminase [Candidatus Diapherotrites archaeon]